jgi:hypothetical protein
MARKTRDHKLLANLEHNEAAHAGREMEAGFPAGIIAAVGAAEVLVGMHMPIRIVNVSGATIYVKFGATGLTAPTGMTDGIAILNNTVEFLNTGNNKYMRFNAASASAQYVIADDLASGEA